MKKLIARLFGLFTREQMDDAIIEHVNDAAQRGYNEGVKQSRTHFRVIPLPFSPEELQGASYGEFVSPRGFACDVFGECSIPAPSQFGYEQRFYYVTRNSLDGHSVDSDLTCHSALKFDKPGGSYELVPVIVTVLR